MAIENIMYFVLGFLAAGFIAVAILPAIWNRAVRLTRRRIEAATPVTLSEFRADKDKLRAEFAIKLRRLEMRVDMLRERLTARVVELDAATNELMALRTERDEQYDAIGALKVHEQELVARIRDLERDSAALAARLRQSGVEFSQFDDEENPSPVPPIGADQLSGDYRNDVEDLLTALNIERQRNSMLEDQARVLLSRIEKKRKAGIKDDAIAMLRETLSAGEDADSATRVQLRRAEQRISSAENRLSALLESETVEPQQETDQVRRLADRFSEEEQLAALQGDIGEVEDIIMGDWNSERFDVESLRVRLQGIASDVSRIVYSADAEESADLTESLFDKVRKFAADGLDMEDLPRRPEPVPGGAVAERMAALRDMQAR